MLLDNDLPEYHVSKRKGLPSSVKETLLESTRSEWQDHPRFGGKASFEHDVVNTAQNMNDRSAIKTALIRDHYSSMLLVGFFCLWWAAAKRSAEFVRECKETFAFFWSEDVLDNLVTLTPNVCDTRKSRQPFSCDVDDIGASICRVGLTLHVSKCFKPRNHRTHGSR